MLGLCILFPLQMGEHPQKEIQLIWVDYPAEHNIKRCAMLERARTLDHRIVSQTLKYIAPHK